MEETQQWRDVRLIQSGVGATKFVPISHQVMPVLVIGVPEILRLIETINVAKFELDKLVFLSLVEPIQLLTLDNDAFGNRIFVVWTHL